MPDYGITYTYVVRIGYRG